MEMKLETIVTEIRKIQAIADLLVSHCEEEYGIIGQLISDISFPLLEKMKGCEPTVRKGDNNELKT